MGCIIWETCCENPEVLPFWGLSILISLCRWLLSIAQSGVIRAAGPFGVSFSWHAFRAPDIWETADSAASELQGIVWIQMYLKYKKPIYNPFAAKAWGSRFLRILCVELDKTKRVQPQLWEVRFQVSDLGWAASEDHLGPLTAGTEQAFSSATQMCWMRFSFSFWMDLLPHLNIRWDCQLLYYHTVRR